MLLVSDSVCISHNRGGLALPTPYRRRLNKIEDISRRLMFVFANKLWRDSKSGITEMCLVKYRVSVSKRFNYGL